MFDETVRDKADGTKDKAVSAGACCKAQKRQAELGSHVTTMGY